MTAFTKRPYEEFFRYRDFSPWLNESETIASQAVAVRSLQTGEEQAAMVSDAAAYQDVKVRYKILGGEAGGSYAVNFKITTSNGQRFEDEITFFVI